jgi:hypothetical protein
VEGTTDPSAQMRSQYRLSPAASRESELSSILALAQDVGSRRMDARILKTVALEQASDAVETLQSLCLKRMKVDPGSDETLHILLAV